MYFLWTKSENKKTEERDNDRKGRSLELLEKDDRVLAAGSKNTVAKLTALGIDKGWGNSVGGISCTEGTHLTETPRVEVVRAICSGLCAG